MHNDVHSEQPISRQYDPCEVVGCFRRVAELAGYTLASNDIVVQSLPAPHRAPSALPLGWMAVFVFSYGELVLKIGKAGPNGSSHYASQHYGSPSGMRGTLAARLLRRDPDIGVDGLTPDTVDNWIRNNVSRSNFLIRATAGPAVLTLLEAFLRCRLQPKLEGHAGGRAPGESAGG